MQLQRIVYITSSFLVTFYSLDVQYSLDYSGFTIKI